MMIDLFCILRHCLSAIDGQSPSGSTTPWGCSFASSCGSLYIALLDDASCSRHHTIHAHNIILPDQQTIQRRRVDRSESVADFESEPAQKGCSPRNQFAALQADWTGGSLIQRVYLSRCKLPTNRITLCYLRRFPTFPKVSIPSSRPRANSAAK